MDAEDAAYLRALTCVDWVVSRSWNRLHHVELTDEQCVELEDKTRMEGPIRFAYGRTAVSISIPRGVHPDGRGPVPADVAVIPIPSETQLRLIQSQNPTTGGTVRLIRTMPRSQYLTIAQGTSPPRTADSRSALSRPVHRRVV